MDIEGIGSGLAKGTVRVIWHMIKAIFSAISKAKEEKNSKIINMERAYIHGL